MKNILILILFACLTSCLDISHTKTGLEGKSLPSFNLLLIDSVTHFNTNTIPSKKPIILLYFTPTCPFCRALTEEIVSNIRSFPNVQFYILTNYPFPQLKKYYDHFNLNKYPNIVVGQDYESYFKGYFNPKSVPYMVIYDENKHLKQVLVGKVSIDVIRDFALK